MKKLKILSKEYVVFLVFIVFLIIAGLLNDKFFSLVNITNILRQSSIVIIIGVGVNALMVAGMIDLSVGSITALSAVVIARLVAFQSGFPFILAVIIGISVGLICGIINSFLVVKMNIPSIITTLGTLYIYRGIVYVISGSKVIAIGFPQNYTLIGQGLLGRIPIPIIIMILIFIIFLFIETKTILGHYTYAIGGNKIAAILAGIPVKRVNFSLFMIVGFLCGIAGFILTSRINAAGPTFATGLEFDVILAVLIGGVSLEGGKGSIRGMIFGALILNIVGNSLNLMGVNVAYRQVALGIVFIMAIILNRLIKREKIFV